VRETTRAIRRLPSNVSAITVDTNSIFKKLTKYVKASLPVAVMHIYAIQRRLLMRAGEVVMMPVLP